MYRKSVRTIKDNEMGNLDKHIKERILEFTSKGTFNKVVQSGRKIEGIDYVDLRREFFNIVEEYGEGADRVKIAEFELPLIIKYAKQRHPELGDIIAISNFDLLFDTDYKINYKEFIEYYSRDYKLILQSRSSIGGDMIYFYTYMSKENNQYTIYSSAYLSTTDYSYQYIGPEE